MKKSTFPRRYGILLFLFVTMVGCEQQLVNPTEVTAIKLVWLPANNIRSAPLEINVEANLLTIFVDRFNLSQEIDAIWTTDVKLYEGQYEITFFKKDGEKEFYQFGGESILYSPVTKKYYQNKDLHLFIYQNVFLELIKRKKRIP